MERNIDNTLRTPGLFNPERPQALVARYQNLITKGKVHAIRVEYTSTGVNVLAQKTYSPTRDIGIADQGQMPWVALPEACERVVSAHTDSDQLSYWRNKYEIRLDEECPIGFGGSGSTEEINRSIDSLEFKKRQALRLSNKEFDKKYPHGWVNGSPFVGNGQ